MKGKELFKKWSCRAPLGLWSTEAAHRDPVGEAGRNWRSAYFLDKKSGLGEASDFSAHMPLARLKPPAHPFSYLLAERNLLVNFNSGKCGYASFR